MLKLILIAMKKVDVEIFLFNYTIKVVYINKPLNKKKLTIFRLEKLSLSLTTEN